MSSLASAGLKRRSNPIVVDAFELIALPHSDPATWPGYTSTPSPSSTSRRREWKRPSAPSRPSTARSGRAASPTKSESPVRTIQGSVPRVRSLTAMQQCSGRCPGVWMQRRTMSPSAISSPSSSGSCGYSAPAAGWMLMGIPCSSASRPWPDRWSACVCVSMTRTMCTSSRSASSRYWSMAKAGSTTTAWPVRGSPTRYDAHPSASSTNCVKIMAAPDRTSDSRYFS